MKPQRKFQAVPIPSGFEPGDLVAGSPVRRSVRETCEFWGLSLAFLAGLVVTFPAIIRADWPVAGIGFLVLVAIYATTLARGRRWKPQSWKWENTVAMEIDPQVAGDPEIRLARGIPFEELRTWYPYRRICVDFQRERAVGVILDPTLDPVLVDDEDRKARLRRILDDREIDPQTFLDPEARFLGDVISGHRSPGVPFNRSEIARRVAWLRKNSRIAREILDEMNLEPPTE